MGRAYKKVFFKEFDNYNHKIIQINNKIRQKNAHCKKFWPLVQKNNEA